MTHHKNRISQRRNSGTKTTMCPRLRKGRCNKHCNFSHSTEELNKHLAIMTDCLSQLNDYNTYWNLIVQTVGIGKY
jgi:hypothetical protein